MQQDDNQKNLLLAIVLSLMVLLGWQMFFVNPKIKDEQARKAALQQAQGTPTAGTPAAQPGAAPGAPAGTTPAATSGPVIGGPGAIPTAPVAVAAVTRDEALNASPRVPIETPSLIGSIALKGGRIDDLQLVLYREKADPKSPPVTLLSPSNAPEPYYAELGWLAPAGTQVKAPTSSTDWKVESGSKLTPSTPVTLVYDDGLGNIFRRKLAIDDKYMFTIEESVENKSAAAVTLDHYALLSRHGTPKVEGFLILHEGPIGITGDKLQEVTYSELLKNLKEGEHTTKSFSKFTGGWLGITDKYWGTAFIPDQSKPQDAYVSGYQKAGAKKETFQVDLVQRSVAVAPATTQSVTVRLFAGAKHVKTIESYFKALDIKQFDLMIDWGYLHFITKPLFYLIDWLGTMLGNLGVTAHFGIAILLTTVIVKALFFPLANKSYESMAKMKKLQPEMERLRERYKDDKARQQQELMELYKKEKINPAAGCLPVVLQIPVFFALYKVLFVTIDMRHAPFYGWIKDLSAPDPTTIFNLFGLLPFAVPDFLHVGLWPILMGITMWLQMQLNPQSPDPVQQKVFAWMPVMFTFMLASFPVGLVIYWAWSNVLSLLQQYTINKKHGSEIHLWKNLGLDKLQQLISKGEDSKSK